MKIIDISRPLMAGMPTWPGDTPFHYVVNWPKAESGSVNVGKITMSVHTGTHVDAPFHFDDDGRKMAALPLDLYMGEARVVELTGRSSIGPEDFAQIDLEGVERLLLKTLSWSDPNQFPSTICHLRADLPAFLAKKGIRLIGVDVPSVDPLDSKELAAHHGLHQHDIHILEGLLLDHVESGDYELIALPLLLMEADGSPVRAILRRS
ncbi:arylformamidase [Brevibacillus brevis]|uniref:arylformamidase n=1 Tax=Brevibacillus brevis TaxID=1393 RepID=UPI000D0E506C|nr:arylformamidase [Brevibacillus brevis]PSJ70076.1 arylformamidase [Brevibacillus brevis]RED29943.1 kynurenine formamidase [Brevibacillus brevis]GEC88321.1 kynurenine formamidase [Brevibacillus brevis]VEF88491.1 Kynurenine formamidase [Brevibacillus brevis]